MERAYEAGARYGWNEALNNQRLFWLPVDQTQEFTAWCAMPVVQELVRQLEERQGPQAPASAPPTPATGPIDMRNLAATAAKFPEAHARTFGQPLPLGEIPLNGPRHGDTVLAPPRPAIAQHPLPQAPSDRFSPEQLAAAAAFLASQQQPVYPPQQRAPEQNIVSETLRRFGRA